MATQVLKVRGWIVFVGGGDGEGFLFTLNLSFPGTMTSLSAHCTVKEGGPFLKLFQKLLVFFFLLFHFTIYCTFYHICHSY